MKRWALIDITSNNAVITIVDQETKPTIFVEELKSDWIDISDKMHVSSGYRYNDATKDFELIKSDTVLTRSKFMEELGDKYVDVVAKSKTDAAVEVWLEKFRMQETFNLSEQSVKDQVNFLVSKNILSRSAADKLLSL